MAETLAVRQAVIVTGQLLEGSLEESVSLDLTVGQANMNKDAVVADDYGTRTMWSVSGGVLSTYLYGYVLSSHDIFVELQSDHSTEEYALFFVPANVLFSLPRYIGAQNSAARVDGAAFVQGTDYEIVKRIQIQRDAADGVGDATVSLYLFA